LGDTQSGDLAAPKDLLPYLTNASYGSVLFIDEIHRELGITLSTKHPGSRVASLEVMVL
jgi:Holliday junction resolvasome RuvABC ATP-dependent DNA helicase subunit